MTEYLITSLAVLILIIAGCSDHQSSAEPDRHNVLTEQEKAEGWQLLFDGYSTEHWRGYNADTFPDSGWTVRDGLMIFEPFDREGYTGSQNIITKEKFENFHLKMDWKIGERTNSGIFYGVLEQEGVAIFWSGLEYQIIDHSIFSEINEQAEKRLSGALYDLVPASPQNTRPTGEWNQAEIIVDGSAVIHRQNGETILEVERWTPEWFEMVRNTKFECHNEFANVRKGHLGIQDQMGLIKLRNIKIKNLNPSR